MDLFSIKETQESKVNEENNVHSTAATMATDVQQEDVNLRSEQQPTVENPSHGSKLLDEKHEGCLNDTGRERLWLVLDYAISRRCHEGDKRCQEKV